MAKKVSIFNKVMDSLLIAQQVLMAMKAMGVDVDRLIGISNAQGPLAGQIKEAISVAQSEHPEPIPVLPTEKATSKKALKPKQH